MNVRIERLDMAGEVGPVLEIELVAPARLGGHGEHDPHLLGAPRHRCAELLVDENAGAVAQLPRRMGVEEPLEDQRLGVRNPGRLLARRDSHDAEQLLLERAAVVERKHVEISVVAQHRGGSFSARAAQARRTLVVREGAQQEAERIRNASPGRAKSVADTTYPRVGFVRQCRPIGLACLAALSHAEDRERAAASRGDPSATLAAQ